MQNLTTTLLPDLKLNNTISLPAGKALFNWIDISNIAEVAAIVMDKFQQFENTAIELTGNENMNFYDSINLLNTTLNTHFQYKSVNPVKFYQIKKQQGVSKGMAIVMIMLHFIPRFQKPPKISTNYEKISSKSPTTLKEFFTREKQLFLSVLQ
jgi:hypothetical protein